jgi:hypothetical protein
MKRINAILIAFALMLAGSVGGIMAWNLVTQTGRAQDESGGFGGGFGEEFGGGSREAAEPDEVLQVWAEVMFIQMDTADLDEIEGREDALITPTGEKAMLTAEEKVELLRQLREKPSFEFIGTASLVTISGQQALVQMVEEVRYPTEYEDGGSDGDTAYFIPGTFEDREVGIRFNLTPTICSDGLVVLVMLPEASRLSGWRRAVEAGAEQPIFDSWNVTTSVYCRDGGTFVMTGALAEEFEKSLALNPERPPQNCGRKSAVIMVSAKLLQVPFRSEEGEAK